MINNTELEKQDPELYEAIHNERLRQENNVELIASENFVSNAVREANGSIMTNKYAEGYPGKRYYGGCEFIDMAENLAIERAKKLFGCKFANVQAHSGSSANMAAYKALLNHNDVILGMSLDAGGHLTHGYRFSFSGQEYVAYSYGVNEETGLIDYDEVERIALEKQPKLIVAGASAYARIIDFKRFREIADKVGAYLMVDMAHIAGLVAAGYHPSPVPYAHIVTSTTQKTLRGPRGGLILTNDEDIAKKIDKAVFPVCQGGPLENTISGKAVAFLEDLQPSFAEYISQVVLNASAFAKKLADLGFRIITGGTDNHLLLVDVKSTLGITGLEAQKRLEKINITCNKNSIPGDKEKPAYCSGIRLGTPAMTTRGYKEKEFVEVAEIINDCLRMEETEESIETLKARVRAINGYFPLPYEMK
ncbi:MAG: serine hydroxymethyltransferase [Bacilli bacterium]